MQTKVNLYTIFNKGLETYSCLYEAASDKEAVDWFNSQIDEMCFEQNNFKLYQAGYFSHETGQLFTLNYNRLIPIKPNLNWE